MSLLKAYLSESIPANGGFIISSFLDPDSPYSIYEITAYGNVKDIYRTPEGLTFKTDGNRAHILIEPATYTKKHVEPVFREAGKSVPYRFSELTILTGSRQEKIMISQAPVQLYSSFTILNSGGDDFSYIFYPTEDVYLAIKKFVADVLYNDSHLMKVDALEATNHFLTTIKKFNVWED